MAFTQKRRFRFTHLFLRLMFTRQLREKECSHLNQIRMTNTEITVCEDCLALGDTWPELRMCLICGYVGCCDASKNKHARKHFLETVHPIMRPVERGIWYEWMWCYKDEALLLPVW